MARKILILGGTGGIGEAIARACVQAGHEVHVTYHKNEAKAGELQEELGISIHAYDQNSEQSCQNLMDAMESQGIQNLVNSVAEGFQRRLITKYPANDFMEYISHGLKGAYQLCQKLAQMAKANETPGCIVHLLSSVVQDETPSKQVSYLTLKYALLGLAKAQSAEFLRYGIRVNCLCPGMTQTAFHKDLPELFLETVAHAMPLKRLWKPREVAGEVMKLIGGESSNGNGLVMGMDPRNYA